MSTIGPQDDSLAGTVSRQVATTEQEKTLTFTILHTNDMHSNLIGIGPASEYSPTTLHNDATIGGIERIASLIAVRRKAREAAGPVLVLDIGDFSIGTAFGVAIRETGAELQCLSMAGYDATTIGNHEFDFGPDALAKAIAAANKAGHVPPVLTANTHFDADDAGLSGLKELGRAGLIRSHMLLERGGIRFGLFG
jgi:5'-nucleotidase